VPTAGRTIIPAPVVTVTGRPHPFRVDRFEPLRLPPGLTAAEMVELVIPVEFRPIAVVFLDDARGPLHRERLHRIRPKAGTFVRIVPVPERGGDILRSVLMVAVFAAAATAVVATGGIAGAALGAAITTGGMLGINALVPPEAPVQALSQREAPGQTFSIEGARNSADLRGPVPWILGRVRHFPKLAAQQVSEISGDDVYLRMLVTWGYADLQIDQLQIGETSIDEFSDVQTETLQAEPGQVSDHSLYSGTASIGKVGADLTRDAGWVTRDTALAADRSIVNIYCNRGLIQYSHSTGDKQGLDIDFEVRFRVKGTDAWSEADSSTIHGKTASAVRRAIVVDFPQRGQQWELSVRRTTEDNPGSDRIFGDTQWETVSSYTWENPVRLGGLATTALYGKAGDQFSGVIDELNAVVTRVCLDWDRASGAWAKRATRNPASLFRHLLQGPGTKKPRPDARIMLADLQDWHEWCQDNGYTCDMVIDGRQSLEDALRAVAACGRATLIRPDGKYSVAIDRIKPLVTIYAPNNTNNLRTRRTFLDQPHALYVEFPNEDKAYQTDYIYVYSDGYDETNATKIVNWQFPGVTNRDLVWKHGRKRLAELIHRQLRHELDTDIEALAVRIGDRVGLANDVILTGLGWGRVTALDIGGGVLSRIQLDEAVVLPGGTDLVVRVRDLDGTINVWSIQSFAGQDRWLTLAEAVPDTAAPEPQAIVVVGFRGREIAECLVKEIRPGPDMRQVTLALVPAADAMQVAELGDIPAFDSGITAPPGGMVPVITTVRSDTSVLQRDSDGSWHLQMLVTLYHDGRRALSRIGAIELQWLEVDSGGGARSAIAGADATEISVPGVEVGATYRLRARYRFRGEDGRAARFRGEAGRSERFGAWSGYTEHVMIGPNTPPPEVGAVFIDQSRVAWTMGAAVVRELKGFILRYSTVAGQPWDQCQVLSDEVLTVTSIGLDEVPDGAAEVCVKAVTTALVESATDKRAAVAGVPRPILQDVNRLDLAAAGFPGTITGAQVSGDTGALAALSTALWGDPPTAIWGDPPTGPWMDESFGGFQYDFVYTVPQDARDTDSLRLDIGFVGEIVALYQYSDDATGRFGDAEMIDCGPASVDTWPWPADDLPFGATSKGVSGRPMVPWRRAIRAFPGQTLTLRVVGIGGGSTQTAVSALAIVHQAPETSVTVGPITLPAGGGYVTPGVAFRRIAWVSPTVRRTAASSSAAYVAHLPARDVPDGVYLAGYGVAGEDEPVELVARIGGV
jgi:hypothetical protein